VFAYSALEYPDYPIALAWLRHKRDLLKGPSPGRSPKPIIRAMSKRKWRITRIRGNRADQLGVVEATDADTAIKLACKTFQITDKLEQSRIAAMPDRRSDDHAR